MVFQVALAAKNLPASAGDVRDVGLLPASGRFPAGGHSHPPQYSCLENPTDREAWQGSPWGQKESDSIELIVCKVLQLICDKARIPNHPFIHPSIP